MRVFNYLCSMLLLCLVIFVVAVPASAQQLVRLTDADVISIGDDDVALNLKEIIKTYQTGKSSFQLSTAPSADGIVNRIEVEATQTETAGNWVVFALANTSDRQIDRVLVAPWFRLAGSGLIWPDLGSERIISITPSEGFALDREIADGADQFQITLDPGSVVTFVAELATPSLPQIYLWEPQTYKDTTNAYTLFRGIVIGIAGLLALFMTVVFVVRGTSLFPATAALAWLVLLYITIDFGFFDKLIALNTQFEPAWRAAIEVGLAASLLLFLFAYLNLNRWHNNFSLVIGAWIIGLFALFAYSLYDPAIAAGIARISFTLEVVLGVLLVLGLSYNGYDRAVMLIPTWTLLCIWTIGGGMTIMGVIDNDIIQPALGGGMVLIVLLIGFTVMQHAFSGGSFQEGLFSDMERKALALIGSGDVVWDWDVARDRIFTTPDISPELGMARGTFDVSPRNWLAHMHQEDRDHFRTTLDVITEQKRGQIKMDVRMRAEDGHYVWYALRARPVMGSNGEIIRCVGTLSNTTDQKKSEERLLRDAVHDNLTGLPNRELLLSGLESMLKLASVRDHLKPSVFLIDMDRFRQVNDGLGISAGDTMLLTVARRLQRLLAPEDSLSRISGDQFALVLVSEQEPGKIAEFAEKIKAAIRSPLNFARREIILTASIGLATAGKLDATAEEMLKDAELAMFQAKRFGGDRIEPFRPAFRAAGSDKLQLESDLRRAVERNEISVVYQPIIRLEDQSVAGFEALMRWHHPRRGLIPPSEFIPIAETSGLIVQLGLFSMQMAAEQIRILQESTGDDRLFVSVNLSSLQLIRQDLVTDVRSVLSRSNVKPSALKLELTESIVMDNPERAVDILTKLKALGIGLSLDDFGTGYSSLSYLTRFPFDTLKIDRTFLSGDHTSRGVLLKSIIALGLDLDMQTIAEGVATQEDAEHLRALGCTHVQSYIFGEPTSFEQALHLVKEQKSNLKAAS